LYQDTVDNGVTKHLYEELEDPDNWDVFIGHYLGVDHAGQLELKLDLFFVDLSPG
jgi:hypothetical protein